MYGQREIIAASAVLLFVTLHTLLHACLDKERHARGHSLVDYVATVLLQGS